MLSIIFFCQFATVEQLDKSGINNIPIDYHIFDLLEHFWAKRLQRFGLCCFSMFPPQVSSARAPSIPWAAARRDTSRCPARGSRWTCCAWWCPARTSPSTAWRCRTWRNDSWGDTPMMSNGSGSQGQRCFYTFLHDFWTDHAISILSIFPIHPKQWSCFKML